MAISVTTCPGDATVLSRGSDAEIICAVGGDGTVREVAEGLLGSQKIFTFLPMGTVNLLAAEVGLQNGSAHILRGVEFTHFSTFYPARVNDRTFVVTASVGFDADVVASIDLRLKRRIGKGAYILAAIRRFWSFSPERITVRIDGVNHHCGGAIIANGQFYAGRFVCAPKARVTNSQLYACLMQVTTRKDLLRYVCALAIGRFDKTRGIDIIEGKEISILNPGKPIQADGDIVCDSPATISSIPSDGIKLLSSV